MPLNPWRGHFPITSLALVAILHRESAGVVGFSLTERVLYVACEFWAAVHARELETHLDLASADPLESARIAFSMVGAPAIAAALSQFVGFGALDQHDCRQRLAALAEHLVRIPESVDLAIARYARRCLREELGFSSVDAASTIEQVDEYRLHA